MATKKTIRRPKRPVTEEIYSNIKDILTRLPKDDKERRRIMKALDYSNSTLYKIMSAADYKEYKLLAKRRASPAMAPSEDLAIPGDSAEASAQIETSFKNINRSLDSLSQKIAHIQKILDRVDSDIEALNIQSINMTLPSDNLRPTSGGSGAKPRNSRWPWRNRK